MTLRVQSVTGAAIQPYISELARLRIEIFRDYPYLYDGDEAYENSYLRDYAASPDHIIVIAFADEQIIGASTAMPLSCAAESVQYPFLAQDFPIAEIFYLGESVLQKQYRGQGVGVEFFEAREAHARQLNAKYCVFCAVERPLIHPRRPLDYVSLDKFWHKRGYQKRPELQTAFSWKEIGESQPSEKPMLFWMKRL